MGWLLHLCFVCCFLLLCISLSLLLSFVSYLLSGFGMSYYCYVSSFAEVFNIICM